MEKKVNEKKRNMSSIELKSNETHSQKECEYLFFLWHPLQLSYIIVNEVMFPPIFHGQIYGVPILEEWGFMDQSCLKICYLGLRQSRIVGVVVRGKWGFNDSRVRLPYVVTYNAGTRMFVLSPSPLRDLSHDYEIATTIATFNEKLLDKPILIPLTAKETTTIGYLPEKDIINYEVTEYPIEIVEELYSSLFEELDTEQFSNLLRFLDIKTIII